MRNGSSVGTGTVLPGTNHVKQKSRKLLRAAEPTAPAVPETVGSRVFLARDNKVWPRTFDLPGLAFYHAINAEDLVAHLCGVLLDFDADLHELVARHAHARPRQAAELAELLAIVEQVACAGGLATDLDQTPVGDQSPFLRLAALARVQATNKQKGGQH